MALPVEWSEPLGFWAERVVVEDRGFTSPCWIWTRFINYGGYGNARLQPYTTRLAHRISYMEAVGPIPDGYEVDHLCHVRRCCNPAHLEAVPKLENIRRGLPALRAAAVRRRRPFCKYGHPAAEFGRIAKGGSRYCSACHLERDRRKRAADGQNSSPIRRRSPIGATPTDLMGRE